MELPTCKRRGGRFGICTVETLSESFCPSTISNATALETWGCVLSLGFSSSERNNSRLLTLYEISLFFFRLVTSVGKRKKKFWAPWRIEPQFFFFVPRSWRDEKHLSIFLYRAQNLPSVLFYISPCFFLVIVSNCSSFLIKLNKLLRMLLWVHRRAENFD